MYDVDYKLQLDNSWTAHQICIYEPTSLDLLQLKKIHTSVVA